MVFLGTLGVTATALLVLVAMIPERFGFARVGTASEGGIAPASGERAEGSPVAPSPVGEGLEASDRRRAEGLPISDDGVDVLPGSVDWAEDLGAKALRSASTPPFAVRPPAGVTNAHGPRPVLERQSVPPTLPERIFADANPSVVLVATLDDRPGKFRPVRFVAGTGSGLIWDREGHIVTSSHVIEQVKGANVTLSDGSRWAAKLINFDRESDVAVLQIKSRGTDLTPIRVGTSYDLVVGMTAFSVACPYALRGSLASGLISGLNRNIQTTSGLEIGGMIQTDAPLHPGSSGGALIDDQGRVIGMNTAVHLESGLTTGVGFAIPMDRLQEIVPRLIRTGAHWFEEFGFITLSAEVSEHALSNYGGYLTRAKMGGASPLSRPVAEREPGLPSQGLVIRGVEADSGAEKAGLLRFAPLGARDGSTLVIPRDVVIGVSGEPISNGLDLKRAIAALGPDEPLKLDVWRNGIELSVLVQRTSALPGNDRPQDR